MRRLLAEGVSANHCNFDFVQPLHEACFYGKEECVQILIEAGAQVNGRNIDGATPLCDACSSGSEECVRILLENGAFVNPTLLLSSPLHEAVLRDQWRCAELLVAAGANLNHTDCHFGTPLHAAVYKSSVNCVRVLLRAGCNVNSVKILNTPLHVAARQQDQQIVSLLLDFGANPYMKNNFDQSPRSLVPSATSGTWKLLQFWESHPRDLKFLCRQAVRQSVGVVKLRHLDKFQLPRQLTDYLMYTNYDTT